MYSSSTWFGLKSPEMPAKRYTSVSPTVLRTVTVLPRVRAAIAVAASVRAVIVLSSSSWVSDEVHPSAVHVENLGSHEPGFGRREERTRVRNVLGLSVPANHRTRRERLEVGLGAPRPGHVGEDEPRRDRVNGDPMRSQLQREA